MVLAPSVIVGERRQKCKSTPEAVCNLGFDMRVIYTVTVD